MSHRSPVYPGLQPASHLPVVMLHALSFKQCPVQLYRHAGPYLPCGHSIQKKPNIIHYFLCICLLVRLSKSVFCVFVHISQNHIREFGLRTATTWSQITIKR